MDRRTVLTISCYGVENNLITSLFTLSNTVDTKVSQGKKRDMQLL